MSSSVQSDRLPWVVAHMVLTRASKKPMSVLLVFVCAKQLTDGDDRMRFEENSLGEEGKGMIGLCRS